MTNLKLGSLFDGSGGFPLGGVLAGITSVWASEVEPFAVRVTTKRFPFMKHYGDISAMDGGKIEPVDIITFGSPCQDMSVAGKRSGLDGQRSGLFYQAVRIIKEMRKATNGKYPRYIVWENVPGAFSSNNGYDFKAVLEAVIGIVEEGIEVPMPEKGGWPYADLYLGDRWSVAYRTLDAQYWGVPQRRRRIYLVADFAGRRAGDILFKSEGVSGYSAESFRAWQRAANSTKDRSRTTSKGLILNDQGGNRMDVNEEVTCTLRAEAHHPPCVLESAGFCTEHSADSRSIGYEAERSPTLRAGVVPAAIAIENHPADGRVKLEDGDAIQTLTSRMGTGGGNVPLVMNWDGGQIAPTLTKQNAGGNQRMPDKDNFNCVLQPFGICSKDSNAMKSANPHSGIYEADTSRTLDGNGGNPSCNQGGIAVVCIDQGGGKSACNITEEKAPTLACTHGGEPAVCVKSETIVIEGNGTRPSHQGDGFKESDVMYTLNTVDRHAVYAMTTGSFTHVEKEKSPTLMARDYKDPNAVCYGVGRDTFNQGKNAKFAPSFSEEVQPTMVAKGPGAVVSPYGFDPSCARDLGKYFLEDCGNTLVNGTCPGHHNGVMEPDYTVRRLTPTECARLQGFPDWWCSGLDDKYPAIQDIRFWMDVWNTYASVIGGCKPKNEKQIRRWLEHPHSDSAEYKLWGNGVALPCVFFVLSGIVYYTQIDTE